MRHLRAAFFETMSDVTGRGRASRSWSRLALGAALIVLAVPVGWLLAKWPGLHAWSASLDALVEARGGPWRLMRGVLAHLAIPALLLGAGVMVVVVFRRSRHRAMVLAGAMVGANLMVQVVKHPVVWHPDWAAALDPLSGHAAVSSAVLLASVLVVPTALRPATAAMGTVVVWLVGVGVVLASWHTVVQVICPFIAALGWVILADGLLPPPTGSRHRSRGSVLGVTGGVLVCAFSLVAAARSAPPTDSTLAGAAVCLLGAIGGLAVAGFSALTWLTSWQALGDRTPVPPSVERVSPAA